MAQAHSPPQEANRMAIQELSNQLDSFLAKKMLEEALTDEQAKEMRKKEFVEVTVHGKNKEMLSVEGLERKF